MLTIDPERLGLARGGLVLDLGCGRGRHAHALAARGGLRVIGLDRDAGEIEAARDGFLAYDLDGWALVRGDACALPFPDGAFDAVICSEVLEHLADYGAALDEIARVTRPGGVFALSVPRSWPEAICWSLSEHYRSAPGGHVRIFDARALEADVSRRGFSVYARHGAHALHSPYWWLRCAVWADAERHPLVGAYRRVLEWQIAAKPILLAVVEKGLDPVLGKSIVLYFRRAAAP